MERAVVRGHRTPGEADSRSKELAASVEHSLLDHLVRALEQRRRDSKAERLGGLRVDDEFEFPRLLQRKITWLGAFENLDVISTLASCPA
jgi:hypothetical protein